jgi:hypothetical protein
MSVISLGELMQGLERLPSSARKQQLILWLNSLSQNAFRGGRILPVTEAVALEWGRLDRRALRTVAPTDALIAATALVHDLAVVTRNEHDFAGLGVRMVNPWR